MGVGGLLPFITVNLISYFLDKLLNMGAPIPVK